MIDTGLVFSTSGVIVERRMRGKMGLLTFAPRTMSISPIFGDGNQPSYLAVKQFIVAPNPSTGHITLSTSKLDGSTSVREQYRSFIKSVRLSELSNEGPSGSPSFLVFWVGLIEVTTPAKLYRLVPVASLKGVYLSPCKTRVKFV